MGEGMKVGRINEHLVAALQQHANNMTPKERIDGVISIDDALSIVDHYGPTGADVNETFQIQMVLRDKVREQEVVIAQLHARIEAADKQNTVWPIMGEGRVAVGQCRYSADNNVPGLIYLKLDAPRDIGADAGDVYPVGQPAADSAVLACVYFLTPEAVQQSIEILGEIQRDAFP